MINFGGIALREAEVRQSHRWIGRQLGGNTTFAFAASKKILLIFLGHSEPPASKRRLNKITVSGRQLEIVAAPIQRIYSKSGEDALIQINVRRVAPEVLTPETTGLECCRHLRNSGA